MADAVIGSAYLQVIPKMDMKSLKTQGASAGKSSGAAFSKSFGGGLNGIGSIASKAFSVVTKAAAVAGAAATTTLAVVGKQAFDAYASYEQLSGGITKLFGDADQTVFQHAQEAYRTAGMSANEYMQQVSGFAAALTSSLGGDTVKAAEQADVAMRAISDNVNTFGTDIDTVTQAYQGFARQQYQMLDSLRLGYGGTKSEMERLIADANEWGKANGKASDLSIESFSDVVTAIDYIQQKQRIAGTTAAEAGRTISGSIGAAKSAWSNLLAEFGKADGDIKGAMEALVTSIVGDGTDGNLGVIGNVVPRIGIIIKNAVEQIPGLVMAVAPRIGAAFLDAFDSATNGLGTQVLEFLAPVTDAIGSTIGSIGEWFAQNQGAIDSVVGALGNFASVIVDGVAGAIEFLAPIIGDLASGALPILSAAFEAAAGFAQGLGNMFSNLLDAISPITSALAPIVDAIGTALVNALKWAGDAMSNADFSGFASIVKDALGGVVDFIGDTINNLTGFFDAVAQFLDDPIGSIQRGFDSLVSGSKKAESGVATNFRGIEKDVDRSLDGAGRSVDDYNRKPLNSKSSSASVNGNAIDGTAITAVGNTNRAVGSMTGNNVTVTATGNATDGSAAANIWNTVAAVAALASSTGNFSVGGGSGYSGSSGGAFAEGGIRYHADGMILNRATWIGGRDIAGEDGAEAIIPLTNKRYTRPFAETVAEQMGKYAGGITVNINGARINDDAEIERCTYQLLYTLERKGRM